MNETKIMLPAAGSLTDFFTAISTLANEYQTAGNAVLIGIALLILGSKFLIGDDESKARGSFRNDKNKPLVGDYVTISILDEEKKTGSLDQIRERKNELIRPLVANVDQAIVIFAIKSPAPNFMLLDTFLA